MLSSAPTPGSGRLVRRLRSPVGIIYNAPTPSGCNSGFSVQGIIRVLSICTLQPQSSSSDQDSSWPTAPIVSVGRVLAEVASGVRVLAFTSVTSVTSVTHPLRYLSQIPVFLVCIPVLITLGPYFDYSQRSIPGNVPHWTCSPQTPPRRAVCKKYYVVPRHG